jgi:hypothetical protein
MFAMSTAFSQSAVVSTGGTASGSEGSVTYTVGQIAVQTSSNSSGSVFIAEGVQQPYEIMTIGVDNYPQITLNAVVYPNPTENLAQLKLNGFEITSGGLNATLYDGNGKLLQNLTVTEELTDFQIGHYASGTYYLELRDGRQLLKTFKVVRK